MINLTVWECVMRDYVFYTRHQHVVARVSCANDLIAIRLAGGYIDAYPSQRFVQIVRDETTVEGGTALVGVVYHDGTFRFA
jgi:hypothetical protein